MDGNQDFLAIWQQAMATGNPVTINAAITLVQNTVDSFLPAYSKELYQSFGFIVHTTTHTNIVPDRTAMRLTSINFRILRNMNDKMWAAAVRLLCTTLKIDSRTIFGFPDNIVPPVTYSQTVLVYLTVLAARHQPLVSDLFEHAQQINFNISPQDYIALMNNQFNDDNLVENNLIPFNANVLPIALSPASQRLLPVLAQLQTCLSAGSNHIAAQTSLQNAIQAAGDDPLLITSLCRASGMTPTQLHNVRTEYLNIRARDLGPMNPTEDDYDQSLLKLRTAAFIRYAKSIRVVDFGRLLCIRNDVRAEVKFNLVAMLHLNPPPSYLLNNVPQEFLRILNRSSNTFDPDSYDQWVQKFNLPDNEDQFHEEQQQPQPEPQANGQQGQQQDQFHQQAHQHQPAQAFPQQQPEQEQLPNNQVPQAPAPPNQHQNLGGQPQQPAAFDIEPEEHPHGYGLN